MGAGLIKFSSSQVEDCASSKGNVMVDGFVREALCGFRRADSFSSFISDPVAKNNFTGYMIKRTGASREHVESLVQDMELSFNSSSYESCPVTPKRNHKDEELFQRNTLAEFGGFLLSTEYKKWWSEEKARVLSAITARTSSSILDVDCESRKRSLSHEAPSMVSAPSQCWIDTRTSSDDNTSLPLNTHMFADMNPSDMDLLFNSSMWLPSLIASTDTLPMPFALLRCGATVNTLDTQWTAPSPVTRPSTLSTKFPVVYANPALITLLGGSCKSQVHGTDILDLVCGDESFQFKKTLFLARPCSVTVSLRRFGPAGEIIYNNLSLSPVFDQLNKHRFTIVMMCVTNGKAEEVPVCRTEMLHNEHLCSLLPNRVTVDGLTGGFSP